jgi:hypothetical protein
MFGFIATFPHALAAHMPRGMPREEAQIARVLGAPRVTASEAYGHDTRRLSPSRLAHG